MLDVTLGKEYRRGGGLEVENYSAVSEMIGCRKFISVAVSGLCMEGEKPDMVVVYSRG